MLTRILLVKRKERDHVKDLVIDEKVTFHFILKEPRLKTMNGFISLRIETVVELLLSTLTDLQVLWNLGKY
jgi:hypothetical protein